MAPLLHAPRTTHAGIPDAIEPVCAWRCWSARLVATHGRQYRAWRLASPARGTLWPVDAPLRARCGRRMHRHRAPHERCACGIWALHDAGYDLVRLARSGGMPVVGTIAGWGQCIEGERGWRVEYARPARLIIPDFSPLASSALPPADELAADLAAYGVSVERMDAAELTQLLRGGMPAMGAHR